MKKFLILTGLVLLISCEAKNPEMNPDVRFITTKDALETIAKQLASDPNWVQENRATLANGVINLGDVKPSLSKVYVGNEINNVTIELLSTTKKHLTSFSKGNSNGSFRVALDPDCYYMPEEVENALENEITGLPAIEIPSFYYDGVSSEGALENFVVGVDEQYNEPVFLLNVADDESNATLGKVSGNPESEISGTFLTLLGATLRYKWDEGNEEFEVYLSNGGHPTMSPYLSTTPNMFNDGSRFDASGRTRQFANIERVADPNGGWKFTSMQQPVALKELTNTDFRLIAIESDAKSGNTDGYYNRANDNPGDIIDIAVDAYDMYDNYIKTDETHSFTVSANTSLNDDRYTKSAVRSINLDNLTTRLNGRAYMETDEAEGGPGELVHVNWRLSKITYPN